MRGHRGLSCVMAAMFILSIGVPTAAAYDPVSATERISVDSSGVQRTASSGNAVNSSDISYDGRFVVFDTNASFDPADTNGIVDAYIRDRQLGTTERIGAGNAFSMDAALSADGRYVSFTSFSSDLTSGDTNGNYDVFVVDRSTDAVTRVSVATDGSQRSQGGTTSSISADGRFVTFVSYDPFVATDTNGDGDTYVRDRDTDDDGVFDEPGAVATTQVSVASDGTGANHYTYGRISPNGRYVALGGQATNLIANDQQLCDQEVPDPDNPPNGTITVPADCNDVYLHDRDSDEDGVYDEPGATTTILASATSAGDQADGGSGDPDVSDNGDVAFYSLAGNLGANATFGYADVFVRDGVTGSTVKVGERQSNGPSISNTGRFIAFDSQVSNGGVPDTNNVFDSYLFDRDTGVHTRASVGASGGEVAMGGVDPVVSGDGRHVIFVSFADNLVAGDTNGETDMFARDLLGAPGGTPTPQSQTPVVVQPTDPISGTQPVTLSFDGVATGGTTNLTTSTDGPAPISGFSLGDPPTYYDVSTTATFTGAVEICVSYAGVTFPDENGLRLFHFEMGPYNWVDITTSLDTAADVICGETTSFSPFAIFAGEVSYDFTGFYAPIDKAPMINGTKAGTAIPVRFGLGGDRGLDIFAEGSPSSQKVNCESGAPIDEIEQTVTASASGLSYSRGADTYTYTWKTNKAWAGTCRHLHIAFADDTEQVIRFKFR